MEIPEAAIKASATKRWTDPTLIANHNKKRSAEFHIKLLHLFLINSVTIPFRTTIKNRAGDLLNNDGQYFLWLICHHVHHNKNSYIKSVKDLIRQNTIANHHNNDVEKYISWCTHQLQALQLTENDHTHDDLLDPIFAQLQNTTIERLTTSVNDWYEDHYSNTSELTPIKLLHKADRKLQTLRSANMLTTNKSAEEPSIMALQAAIHDQSLKFSDAFNQLTANLAQRQNHQPYPGQPRSFPASRSSPRPTSNPSNTTNWKVIPPSNLDEVRLFEGREWRWCSKCNHTRGLWVTSHKPWLHQDRTSNLDSQRRLPSQNQPSGTPYTILQPTDTKKRPPETSYSCSYPTNKQPRTNTPYRVQVAVHDVLPSSDEPYDPFGVFDTTDDQESHHYTYSDTNDDHHNNNVDNLYPEEAEEHET